MNKVTTINLNGRAYQLEEGGENVLRKYLETAAAKLAGNPDKDEIMADFEQAIADKFDQKLTPHKNVISQKEIEEIIAAMGPVDGAGSTESESPADSNSGSANSDSTTGNPGAPKRLYRILEDKWIMGVCSGLAAYFNVDLALVRIIFILLVLITHGFAIAAYVILAIVMPLAITEEEYSQAHGWTTRPPFNAHDFIEQAKMKYADLQKMHEEHKAHGSSKEDIKAWKRKMKLDMKLKKQQMKHEWRTRGYHASMDGNEYNYQRYDRGGAGYHASRAIYGFFAVVISLVLLAAGVLWAVGLAQVVQHGMFYGYPLGAGHPLWVSIVFLAAAFYLLSLPFRLLLERAWGHARYRSGWSEFAHAIVFLIICGVLIYTARELFPQVNDAWNSVLMALTTKR